MTNHDLQDQGPRADRPKRRTFTTDYKLRILAAYDTAPTGRLALARCVIDEHWPLRRAAERFQTARH